MSMPEKKNILLLKFTTSVNYRKPVYFLNHNPREKVLSHLRNNYFLCDDLNIYYKHTNFSSRNTKP